MSIDWDEIRRKHDERVAYEIEAGLREPPKEKTVINKDRSIRRNNEDGNHPTAGKPRPSYSHDRIARMYRDGKQVKEIATELGCHPQTVYSALKKQKVQMRPYDRSTTMKKVRSDRQR